MKEVYNATFQSFPEEIRSSHNGDVLSYLNGSLDVLDLGCGTGLIGSWFKDYARKLVGVDVSPTMLDMATKKGCYHELRKGVSEQAVTALTLSFCTTESILLCRVQCFTTAYLSGAALLVFDVLVSAILCAELFVMPPIGETTTTAVCSNVMYCFGSALYR